jgi:hypothetical protein
MTREVWVGAGALEPPPSPLLGKEGGPIRSPSLASRGLGGGRFGSRPVEVEKSR